MDSKLNQTVQYAADGSTSFSKPIDPNRTLFRTSRSTTQFARVRATNERVYISAFGTFGDKIFEFDKTGKELSQTEVFPNFGIVVIDEEAPLIELRGDTLFAATTASIKVAPTIERHFGVHLDWQGPRTQTVLQTFDQQLVRKNIILTRGSDDFFVTGLAVSSDSVAVFGSTGEIGNRKAIAAVYSKELQNKARSEFKAEGEATFEAAVFLGDQLFLGGRSGFLQVSTGSVIVPADMFISSLDMRTGELVMLNKFGTKRNDAITSILAAKGELYVSGVANGPITHTADTDPNLGYRTWFLGLLKR